VPSCVTSLAFHPNNPLLLASGSILGEICLWNIDNEKEGQSLLRKSEADEYLHREAVKKLQWVLIDSELSSQPDESLVSISTDGKLLMWENPVRSLRFPIKGHLIAKMRN
jgi:WD40 repeat protein